MIGHVDNSGRALIDVSIRPNELAPLVIVQSWIDTGFNGDLVLQSTVVAQLNLTPSGTIKAVLADGSQVALETYSCQIDWFSGIRYLEVVANDGDYALLGVGLLLGLDLHISYRSGEIAIE